MKMKIAISVMFLSILLSCGRNVATDFKTIQVNKKVKDFPDELDLSSPLKSALSINYLMINGKDSLWRQISSEVIKPLLPDTTTAESYVTESEKNKYLNTLIREIITYRDSVACVISEIRDSSYTTRWLYKEHSNWVNRGEDERKSIQESEQLFREYAKQNLQELRKINAFALVPKDTLSFIRYLQNNTRDSKEFVFEKLSKYKLVMYGEIHRRKASWDFLQEILKDKRFVESAGVIFMELGSDKQGDIDKFLENNSIDNELLLNVFRDYIICGWNDKDKFDFIKTVWKINQNLPSDKKIRIIAVDTPRPFNTFTSKEDMRKNDAIYDRDKFMADTIINYLNQSKDKRNALFIVGTGHVCKASQSAGSMLSKELPDNTYAIFQHSPRVDNFAPMDERLRHGIFDNSFYQTGDRPIAFEIKNSPFGKEPFDGLFYDGNGTYQDNYDGYIFLGPLDSEPNGEILLDLYSDNFVKELDRRYQLLGSNLKDEWGLTDFSKKAVIEKVLSNHTKTRWENIIKPLKSGITIQ